MTIEEQWAKIRVKAAKLVYKSTKLLNILSDPIEVITKSAAKSRRFEIDLTDYKDEIQKVLNQFQEEINLAKKGNKDAAKIFRNKASQMGYDIDDLIDGNGNYIPQPNEDTVIYKIIYHTKYYIYALSQANFNIRLFSPKPLQRLYKKRVKYWSNKKQTQYSSLEWSIESLGVMIQQYMSTIDGLIKVM